MQATMLGNRAPADILDIVKNNFDAGEVTHMRLSLRRDVGIGTMFMFRPGTAKKNRLRERKGGGG